MGVDVAIVGKIEFQMNLPARMEDAIAPNACCKRRRYVTRLTSLIVMPGNDMLGLDKFILSGAESK